MAIWSAAATPSSRGPSTSFTLRTASTTPLPTYRRASPSRSSTASCSPVEAPLGTAARPCAPLDRVTSVSTVGLPRLSRISRAWTSMIVLMNARVRETGQPSRGAGPASTRCGSGRGSVEVVVAGERDIHTFQARAHAGPGGDHSDPREPDAGCPAKILDRVRIEALRQRHQQLVLFAALGGEPLRGDAEPIRLGH